MQVFLEQQSLIHAKLSEGQKVKILFVIFYPSHLFILNTKSSENIEMLFVVCYIYNFIPWIL